MWAYIYRTANSMTLEQFQKFDSKVMDKLGHQEVGFEVAQAL